MTGLPVLPFAQVLVKGIECQEVASLSQVPMNWWNNSASVFGAVIRQVCQTESQPRAKLFGSGCHVFG